MIEDYLLNYGVLGLWTGMLLYERFNSQKKILEVLNKILEKLG